MTQSVNPPEASHATGIRAAFVGRKRETEELRAALEDSLSGTGRIVLLAGEAGIGKTTLADQITAWAATRGVEVLWGRCWEAGEAPALWPWIQVLRACLREDAPAQLASLLKADATDLARLLPELASQPHEAGGPWDEPLSTTPPFDDEQSEQKRFRQFDAVAAFLLRASTLKPRLMVFDDCHAADESSLLLLRFLARNLRQSRIMVIVTYREAEIRLRPRVAELIGDLEREGQRIVLGGIDESDVYRFIERTAGLNADPPMVSALYHATEGNPFFLTEILRLLIAEGSAPKSDTAHLGAFRIPGSLRAAIRRRLELVSQRTAAMLKLAAAVGREFDLVVVEKISGLGSEELLDAIDEAMAAALISEDSDVLGRYRFVHALFSSTLYEELPKNRRNQLHLQIAETMEELYAGDLEEHSAELAYHYVQSLTRSRTPPGQIEKAISYASRAARRARELLAYEESTRLYQMALKALDLKQLPDRQGLCELLLGLADASYQAGIFNRSRRAFEHAAGIARSENRAEVLARAVLGIALLPSDPGTVDQVKVALLEEALTALGDRDTSLRAMLLARLARELHYSEVDRRRESLSQAAVDVARRLADTPMLIYVLINRHIAAWGPDNLDERLAVATEALRRCEESGNRLWAPQARYLRIVDLLELGEVQAVDQEIEYYSLMTEKSWLPLGYRERAQATRSLMEGRFEEAERLGRQALALGRQIQRRAQLEFSALLIALRWQQGRLAELEVTLASEPTTAMGRCWRAFFFTEMGRLAEARAQFDLLSANNFAAVRRDAIWLNATIWLAEVCRCLGDVHYAQLLYQMLAPYADRNVVVDLNACYGSVAHYLGILATTMARFDEAQDHFEIALRFNQRMSAPPFIARTQFEYAAMLINRGRKSDRERAFELLSGALTNAEAIGMAAVAQKARTLLSAAQAAGQMPNPPVQAPATDPEIAVRAERVLATILFIDIVASTAYAAEKGDRQFGALLDQYYILARKEFKAFEGREINTAGDGMLAIFDRPAHAIRCACAIRDAVREIGIKIRAGLHAGELELNDKDVRGIAVHIGARIVSAAGAEEVLVSSTVKDLVAGSGFEFADHGLQTLKGLPGEWRLFLVGSAPPSRNPQDLPAPEQLDPESTPAQSRERGRSFGNTKRPRTGGSL